MLVKAPSFWQCRGVISTILLPVSGLYYVGSRVWENFRQPQALPCGVKVICVGNIVAGGAGKTPMAITIAHMLVKAGHQPFFLSRGYAGKLCGPVRVDPAVHNAVQVGDEPLLLASHFPTIVSKDRLRGAFFAVAGGASIIIMDDGLQNQSLKKDFSLIVVDGEYRFGNERMLPAGPLRQPVSHALKKCDAVVVIDGTLPDMTLPVFHAALIPSGRPIDLKRKPVVAFAGIGRPEKFRRTLEHIGYTIIEFVPFPDHYFYRSIELEILRAKADSANAVLVTTEKDFVRLAPEWQRQVMAVRVTAELREDEAFLRLLKEAL